MHFERKKNSKCVNFGSFGIKLTLFEKKIFIPKCTVIVDLHPLKIKSQGFIEIVNTLKELIILTSIEKRTDGILANLIKLFPY